MSDTTHLVSLDRYTLDQLDALASGGASLGLSADVRATIDAGAACVQRVVERGESVYGVTTGFGALSEHRIAPDDISELQRRHVLSHACGVGPFADEHTARLVLLAKLLTLRSGNTGVRSSTVDRLIALWNAGTIPAIPMQGTVGASGDLAPLAHMALPLLGLGHVHARGRVVPTREVVSADPLTLVAKEGLALTNGVQFITAIAIDAVVRAKRLARTADLVAAISVQGFSGAADFFHPRYHATSPHAERAIVARNLRTLLEGSNHHALPTAVASRQDPYSFRCIPQVHGAIRQTIAHAERVVEDEVNGVSDNPLFFPDEDLVLCGGALHGESIAFVLDYLAIAIAELASISERRTYQLLSGQRGLPDFLAPRPGLDSGFMVAQYTSAALVNHNKVLATPASVDTIPTSQLKEDHVSMGGTSALKLLQVIDNATTVIAIELMTAAQAVERVPHLVSSVRLAEVQRAFRERVPSLVEDRVLADDIAISKRFVLDELPRWIGELS
ncbi:MAG: histidine ammonia-lyase [Kofleriaceae bacterium]